MHIIGQLIPSKQRKYIQELAARDDEVKDTIRCLKELPDLTSFQITDKIIHEQKSYIEMGGFDNWQRSYKLKDERITDEIFKELRIWAKENQYLNQKQILEKMKKARGEHS